MTDMDKIRKAVATLGEGTSRLISFSGISEKHLADFAAGKHDLAPDVLDKVVSFIFADRMEFDPGTGTLRAVGGGKTIRLMSAQPSIAYVDRDWQTWNQPGQMLHVEDDGSAGVAAYREGAKSGVDWR